MHIHLAAALLGGLSVQAAFPGVNGEIAFNRYRAGESGVRFELYQTLPGGSQNAYREERLTWTQALGHHVLGASMDPAYSPAGSVLVYTSNANGPRSTSNHFELHILEVTKPLGFRRTMTQLPEGGSGRAGHPAWSPDGASIAYLSWAGGDSHLYELRICNLGGDWGLLSGLEPQRPAWSPDGGRLALANEGQLLIYNLHSRQGEYLTQPRPGGRYPQRSQPAWSPDGQRLAYTQMEVEGAPTSIWVMNADGSQAHCLLGGPSNQADPEWSPDGRQLAYASNRPGHFEVFVCEVMGVAPAEGMLGHDYRLTYSPQGGFSRGPAWRPLPNAAALHRASTTGGLNQDFEHLRFPSPLGAEDASSEGSVASDATTVPMATYLQQRRDRDARKKRKPETWEEVILPVRSSRRQDQR